MPRRFAHALVIGGTGMLAGATRYVAARSQRLTVVARGAEAACRNMGLDAGAACPADWRARAAFLAAVSPRLGSPLPDLALIWMHASGERAALGLLDALAARRVRGWGFCARAGAGRGGWGPDRGPRGAAGPWAARGRGARAPAASARGRWGIAASPRPTGGGFLCLTAPAGRAGPPWRSSS